MALDDVKHVEIVAILRTISEQPAFRALPLELQQTAEGWLEENHPAPQAYSAAMHAMYGHEQKPTAGLREALALLNTYHGYLREQGEEGGPFFVSTNALIQEIANREGKSIGEVAAGLRAAAAPSMPRCPICGAPSIEGKAQQITREREGMERVTVEPGQIAYKCENGHYHDGEQETGPLPEDITIREGL